MENLEEIVAKLSGIFYLATVDKGQPHVRPFDGAAIVDGELHIGTKSDKKVYAQMLKNPNVEIYALSEYGPVRFSAKASIVKDAKKNEEAYTAIGKTYAENAAAIKLTDIKIIK